MRNKKAVDPAGLTIRNVRRDFPEWHRGRKQYALWALDIATPAVNQRVALAQDHLADLLLADYQRQAHITVSLCGFPADTAQYPDDFTDAMRQAQFAALRRLAPPPFDIVIGGLDTFASVPFFEVLDPDGQIDLLRACLAVGDINQLDRAYTPHVTVGLYADAWPLSDVVERLQRFPAPAPLRLQINAISLLAYAAAEIGGPLTRIATFEFER